MHVPGQLTTTHWRTNCCGKADFHTDELTMASVAADYIDELEMASVDVVLVERSWEK